MARQLRSITVAALRNLLEGEDDDALVIFEADYGDYHHTRQALPIEGELESVAVVPEPGYSNSGFAVAEEQGIEAEYEDWDELTLEERAQAIAEFERERANQPTYLLLK